MRFLGWLLMLVAGGTWIVLAVIWLIQLIAGNDDRIVTLPVLGVLGAIAVVLVGLGALIFYRASKESFPEVRDSSE